MDIFQPTNPNRSPDEQLARRVKLHLTNRREEFRSVRVHAKRDTVRLSGRIPSSDMRQLAVALTHRVAGVRHVQDELRNSPKAGND
jgi:osmotically-inducible protein OsmY